MMYLKTFEKKFEDYLVNLLSNLLILILQKGGIDLVVVYCTLIINNRRTFNQVPVNLQPAVEAELLAMGLGTNGKPLPTQEAQV